MLRWLCALVPVGVLTGFAFLLVTGDYINDGAVLLRLAENRGVHEGDLVVVAGWLLALLSVALLVRLPGRRRRH